MLNLSWLGSAPPGQLTAEQKEIKDGLKGVVHTEKEAGEPEEEEVTRTIIRR